MEHRLIAESPMFTTEMLRQLITEAGGEVSFEPTSRQGGNRFIYRLGRTEFEDLSSLHELSMVIHIAKDFTCLYCDPRRPLPWIAIVRSSVSSARVPIAALWLAIAKSRCFAAEESVEQETASGISPR